MPELFDVANHFDDISVNDAYAATFAFKGQFSSFEESSPDGSIAKKRTLSVKPGTVIPARRAISFFDETWIVGDGNTDGIFNRSIRTAYWMKKSVGLLELLTPSQLLTSAVGLQLHAAVEYLKDTVNAVSDTEYDPFWDVFVAINEPIVAGKFIRRGTDLYRIRGFHRESGGFILAQCDQLDMQSTPVAFQAASSYDPITDRYTGTVITLPAVTLEPSKFYRYHTQTDPKFNAGDQTLVTTQSIEIGTEVLFDSVMWRVLGHQQEHDAWAHHIRRS